MFLSTRFSYEKSSWTIVVDLLVEHAYKSGHAVDRRHNFWYSTCINSLNDLTYSFIQPKYASLLKIILMLILFWTASANWNQTWISLHALSVYPELSSHRGTIGKEPNPHRWSHLQSHRDLSWRALSRESEFRWPSKIDCSVTLLMLWIINPSDCPRKRLQWTVLAFQNWSARNHRLIQSILTTNDNIADSISPVLFFLRVTVKGTQLLTPMSENHISLRKNLSSKHLDNWNVSC